MMENREINHHKAVFSRKHGEDTPSPTHQLWTCQTRLCTCANTPKAEQGHEFNKIYSQNSVILPLHSSGCKKCQQPMGFYQLHCYSQDVPKQEEDPALQSQSWSKDCFSLIVPHNNSDCRSTKLPPAEAGNCIKFPIKRKKSTLLKLSSELIWIQ